MEIRNLRSFAVAVRLERFARAAETLGYTPSTITAHIQALEAELGAFLFFREGGVVRLTPEGEKLLPFAEQMVALAEQAGEAVRSPRVPCGPLLVGAAETLVDHRLGGFLEGFCRRYPDVSLSLCYGSCNEFRSALRRGTLDLALLLDRSSEDPDLEVLDLGEEPLAFAAAPDHPLASGPLTPPGLEEQTLILTEAGCYYRGHLEGVLEALGVHPRAVLSLGQTVPILQLVRAGGGITFLPRVALAGDFEAGTLTELAWEGPEFSLHALLTRCRLRPFGGPARAFWEAMEEHPWQEEAPEASLSVSDKIQ